MDHHTPKSEEPNLQLNHLRRGCDIATSFDDLLANIFSNSLQLAAVHRACDDKVVCHAGQALNIQSDNVFRALFICRFDN